MSKKYLFIGFLTVLTLGSCENRVSLSPKISRFVISQHLHKIDGSEQLPNKVSAFIQKEQSRKRSIASDSESNLNPSFAPENKPKFPLPYFLIPSEQAQFLKLETDNIHIIEELNLRISGKLYIKYFIHPIHESKFDFLRGIYNYVGVDKTEFFATSIFDYYTLVVWNRNNPDRFVFMASLGVEKSDEEIKLNRQIIRELPFSQVLNENRK